MKQSGLKLLTLAVVFFIISGCDQGPAETAGEKIDESIEESKDFIGDAVDEAEDNIEEAGDAIEDRTDEINSDY